MTTIGGDETDVETLRKLLIGRSVVSVHLGGDGLPKYGYAYPEGSVTLDDGTVLLLAGNTGGCICGAGDYELRRLNDMPINGITNVEVTEETFGDDRYEPDRVYRIFVLAQDQRFELAAFEGNDGNGYYGTGFWFTVTPKDDR